MRPVLIGMFLSGVVMIHNPATAQQESQAWIERSNQNAQVLLEVLARFAPEAAGQFGVTGLDEEIFDLKERVHERALEATREALTELRSRLESEQDPAVRQDLEILIARAEQNIEGAELDHRLMLPYFDLNRTVFRGIRFLLDEQVEPERRPAALTRLRRYAGMDDGYEAITVLAEARIRERLADPSLLGPVKNEVEKDLSTGGQILGGIGPLFEEYEIAGYEEAYEALKQQFATYEEFLRQEVMPRAREDFRQPPEIYAFSLKEFGVDFTVEELVSRARVSFKEIQNEMQALAPLVAKEKGFTVTDYRDVIRELKKDQIVGEDILPHYQDRIKDLEKIITAEGIVTLPDRPMQIQLASEAESAALPAPHMKPPRMIGNTGEMGTFMLPLRIPSADGSESIGYDDFTFDAASWTLTAHEGRPGHELQFASLVETGVSIPRALFAFNSVNVEGWALYSEAEVKPYLPLDGQLIACQHRLMRAARAFLDPGLQMGDFTPQEATRVLTEEVVVSEAMALQEVERYSFRMPGQATSYFCGYERIMELRAEMERVLGEEFDRQAFHDFILAQGLLPPGLLRAAVLDSFVPRYKPVN
jgi:uncharacterized protein (DUF885 family)